MKKMWKKNNKAVSPVIATILMVAITVVLAAVLYVMVMGFGGSGTPQAPAVTLTKMSAGSDIAINIAIDRQVDIENIGVSVNGTSAVAITALTGGETGDLVVWTFSPLNAGKVSTSDRIVITTPQAGASIQLVWMPSGVDGADKQLVGNAITI